jgi:hypothetical protein
MWCATLVEYVYTFAHHLGSCIGIEELTFRFMHRNRSVLFDSGHGAVDNLCSYFSDKPHHHEVTNTLSSVDFNLEGGDLD